MQSGKLDRFITIQIGTETTDTVGQPILTWTTLTQCWANIFFESGSEGYQADQKVAEQRVKFTVRYNSAYNERLRILYDNQYFDVTAVEEIGRHDGQVLWAVRKDRT